MSGRVWAVVAGGGTAGHVLPAVAVGQELVRRGRTTDEIRYVGSARGLEARLVPEAGFPITLLPGRGIARRLTLDNLGAVVGLAVAVVRAIGLLLRWRPAVVFSVGGYAALPCAAAAVLLRVPLVVADSNAVPGATNRSVARFAKASAVAFDGTGLPRAVVTGNPVRAAVLAVERTPAAKAEAMAALGLPAGRKVVGVFGGSLGALRINSATVELADAWRDRSDICIRHSVGDRDWSIVESEVATRGLATGTAEAVYHPVGYEPRMDAVYAAADVMVTRAGGSTVADLTAVGLPAILVPLPNAPGDHQTANAMVVARAGGAVVLRDDEVTAERLATEIDGLLADEPRLAAMAAAARSVGHRDAAGRLADLLEEHARRG